MLSQMRRAPGCLAAILAVLLVPLLCGRLAASPRPTLHYTALRASRAVVGARLTAAGTAMPVGLPRPLAVHRDPPAAPWPAPAAPALAPAPWRSRAAPLLGLIAGLTAAALAAVCWRGRRGGDAAAMAALASVRATQVTRNSAKALAQLLDKHQEPVAVKIETGLITVEGAYGLGKVLGKHPNVGEVAVTTNELLGPLGFSTGATFLITRNLPTAIKFNESLRSVSIRLPFMASNLAWQLKEALANSPSVEALELQPKFLLKGALQICGEMLQEFPHLRRFSLSTSDTNVMLGEEGMEFAAAFHNNTSLEELVLHMKAIPSRVAFKLSEGLRQNTTLRVLDLEDCELAQKVVEDLADMLAINGTLETLRLKGNQLNGPALDALATALEANCGLRTLNIANSQIDSAQAERFAAMLQANHTLTELDVSHGEISDPGAFALAEMLGVNTTLRVLNLSRNLLSDQGVQVVAQAGGRLTSLTVGSSYLSEATLTALAENVLAPGAALRELRTGAVDLADKGLVALAKNLRENPTLEVLEVHNYCGYLPSGRRQWVEVEQPIGSRVSGLVDPESTRLAEDELDQVTQQYHEERMRLLKLKQTSRRRKIRNGPPLVSNLLRSVKSRKERMEGDKTANTRRMYTLRAIPNVDFSIKTFTDAGPVAIAEALVGNTTLRKLELRNYQLSSKCAGLLGEMLASNTTLQSLVLEDNYMSSEAGWALAEGLRRNTSLTHLGLRYNVLLDDGAAALASGLQANTTLQSLDLRNNYIGTDGAGALFSVMAQSTSLQRLDLRQNCVLTTVLQSPLVRRLLAESRLELDQDD